MKVCVLTEPTNPWIGELDGICKEDGMHLVRNDKGLLIAVPAHEIEMVDEDIILCPKCNSKDTVSISNGDKPETRDMQECYSCGHEWHIED